jgi:hypothetical protein
MRLGQGKNNKEYTILAPGFAKWWGCDPRALAKAFRNMGHNILEVEAQDYVPWRWGGFISKVLRRLILKIMVDEYNLAILKQAKSSSYDFVLVFKGLYLRPQTLRILRSFGKPVYNIYPDVSFVDHGSNIPSALQYYDCVFTTKSFHSEKEKRDFKIKNLIHVRHGFDPEVHRPVTLSTVLIEQYGCDISFVGCWSPEKERVISYIKKKRKDLKVVVYGIGWEYASGEFKNALDQDLRFGVYGDELAIVYCASKVNLGLLSRAASNPSIRDQTTTRTFQIPASKAFMIHEDTPEVRSYFQPNKEIMLFDSEEDLLIKLDKVLSNEDLRNTISQKGYERCIRVPYDYSEAAKTIVKYFE